MRRLLVVLVVVFAYAAAVAPAQAEVTSVFAGKVPCSPQGGVRFCEGSTPTRVPTFDGVPLDVNVVLPPASMGDGPFPLLERLHGFGVFKTGNDAMAQEYAKAGYAVLSHTARGFYGSCGFAAARAADPAGCARGWTHLADIRFEVRDSQHLQGILVDDGIAQPKRIGVTGESYGGGRSSMLAVLRDRVVLPDGRLAPFTSPKGVPMEIAASVPLIPFSDLGTILAPNGRTLDYLAESPYLGPRGDAPVGVLKQSYIGALGGILFANYFAPPGADPEADVAVWLPQFEAGEPYGPDQRRVVDLFSRFRSSAFRVDGTRPAPLLVYSAFSDDLTTTAEGYRLANRVLDLHPGAEVSLFFADAFGHGRASLTADTPNLPERTREFFDKHLKGVGPGIRTGVELYRQSCDGAPVGAPVTAPSWQEVRRGEVRVERVGAQTVESSGGDPAVSTALDPLAGGSCRTVPADSGAPGTASVQTPAARGGGYTIAGAPTVVAQMSTSAAGTAQLPALLWDVAPDGSRTLITRGQYRPSAAGLQVFQLQANLWRVAVGHRVRLDLLGRDSPTYRPSNGSFSVAVNDLELRLPVRETPDGSQVFVPAPFMVPAGGRLLRSADKEPPRMLRVRARAVRRRAAVSRSSRRAVRVRWRGIDRGGAGLRGYTVQVRKVRVSSGRRVTGRWRTVRRSTKRQALRFRARRGATYRFRVRAIDRVGNRSRFRVSRAVRASRR